MKDDGSGENIAESKDESGFTQSFIVACFGADHATAAIETSPPEVATPAKVADETPEGTPVEVDGNKAKAGRRDTL